jgi:segregation and condensation protein B
MLLSSELALAEEAVLRAGELDSGKDVEDADVVIDDLDNEEDEDEEEDDEENGDDEEEEDGDKDEEETTW